MNQFGLTHLAFNVHDVDATRHGWPASEAA